MRNCSRLLYQCNLFLFRSGSIQIYYLHWSFSKLFITVFFSLLLWYLAKFSHHSFKSFFFSISLVKTLFSVWSSSVSFFMFSFFQLFYSVLKLFHLCIIFLFFSFMFVWTFFSVFYTFIFPKQKSYWNSFFKLFNSSKGSSNVLRCVSSSFVLFHWSNQYFWIFSASATLSWFLALLLQNQPYFVH